MKEGELREMKEYRQEVSEYRHYEERISVLEKVVESMLPPTLSYLGISFGIFVAFMFFSGDLAISIIFSFVFSFYGILFLFSAQDFIANIFSFGRFNKIKKEIEELKELKIDSYSKLKPFEELIRDRCEVYLKDFFEKNLYKKRSGSQKFENLLSEFKTMVEEVSTIKFITTHIPLWEYEEYLIRRRTDHSFRALKKTEKSTQLGSFIKDFSKIQEQKEVMAPERFYRAARHINNWEEINRKRKVTGDEGEEIVFIMEQKFFESIGRKDLAKKVRHISVEDGDGLGYDILSFFENEKEKYIEVKSTKISLKSPFYISRNEVGFLREHTENSFIYRISLKDAIPVMEAYSGSEFLEKYELIPKDYMAKVR